MPRSRPETNAKTRNRIESLCRKRRLQCKNEDWGNDDQFVRCDDGRFVNWEGWKAELCTEKSLASPANIPDDMGDVSGRIDGIDNSSE